MRENIRKIHLCLCEPLGVFRSCSTRIPGWSNHTVHLTDVEAFWWTSVYLQTMWVDIEGLVTTQNAIGSASDKPGSTWECRWQVWEHLKSLWSSLGKTSFGMLLVCLEIVATTYPSMIFQTQYAVCTLIYLSEYLCICKPINLHIVYIWSGRRRYLKVIQCAADDCDPLQLKDALVEAIIKGVQRCTCIS